MGKLRPRDFNGAYARVSGKAQEPSLRTQASLPLPLAQGGPSFLQLWDALWWGLLLTLSELCPALSHFSLPRSEGKSWWADQGPWPSRRHQEQRSKVPA